MASNNVMVVSDGKNVMLHSCLEVVGAKSSEVGALCTMNQLVIWSCWSVTQEANDKVDETNS